MIPLWKWMLGLVAIALVATGAGWTTARFPPPEKPKLPVLVCHVIWEGAANPDLMVTLTDQFGTDFSAFFGPTFAIGDIQFGFLSRIQDSRGDP